MYSLISKFENTFGYHQIHTHIDKVLRLVLFLLRKYFIKIKNKLHCLGQTLITTNQNKNINYFAIKFKSLANVLTEFSMDVSLDVDILKMYFCRKNQAFSEGWGYFTFNAIYADIAHFIQELRSLNEYFKCPITTHATDMGEPMKTING